MPEAERLSLLTESNSQHLPALSTCRGSDQDPDLESPTVLPSADESSPLWRKPNTRRGPLDVSQVKNRKSFANPTIPSSMQCGLNTLKCMQAAAPPTSRASWLLQLFLGNWEKLLVAGILIALIVLVSVKVTAK